jgi:hypothetical protein
MNGFSVWHWLVILILLFLAGFPIGRIIHRTGHSAWWVIAFLIPGIGLIAIWVLAFVRWPAVDRRDHPTPGG